MFSMWRLVAPLVFLLCHVAAFSLQDNYMEQSGMFSSIAAIEDMLFPETLMMLKLEQYHDRLDRSLQGLRRYLDAWKELDLDSATEDGLSARARYLDGQKFAFKVKEADLTKRLQKSRVKNLNRRGDNALIAQGGDITYPDDDADNEDQETEDLEKELEEARNHYEWLTSAFLPNQTSENSSAVGERKQMTPSGGRGGVWHPIDAYLLMKRMSVDYGSLRSNLMELQSDTTAVFKELDEQRERFMFPNTADLHGAAVALVRLQDVYGLNMASLGAGIIPAKVAHDGKDLKSKGKLRTWDYILLGKQAFLLEHHERAIQWFKLAVKASESTKLEGDEVEVIPKLRETIRKHEESSIEDKSERKMKKHKKKMSQSNLVMKRAARLHRHLSVGEDLLHQKLLCRGEKFLSPEYESTLYCRFERLQSPYLLLMPLKMEVLHHSPRIVQYHHFLTDSQINYMVKRARPVLEHSTVHGEQVSMIRISMTGWLSEDYSRDDPLTKVTLKIQEATNLEASKTEDVEQFQVANYGIGGLYNCHPDYGVEEDPIRGDRLATFLIYLSNVSAGGSTVFTRLGVRATPERGSALFWYNMFTEEVGDPLTHHAACPVLYGSKWITTKWIHYNSQFLKRPCALEPFQRIH